LRALILEDEAPLREILKVILGEFSYEVDEASSLKEGENLLQKTSYDLVVADLRLPDGSGMSLVRRVKRESPDTEVLILTAFASTDTIKEAFELGVYDYIEKPFDVNELKLTVRNITDKINLKQEKSEFPFIIGKSKPIEKLKEIVRRVAPYDVNVLIVGESGTGKELVARSIHALSKRNKKPFVAINCAALPPELLESELFGFKKGAFTGALSDKKGLIEKADGGTLFLDEIGDMPVSLQAKLLRFLETRKFIPLGSTEEKSVNVRILAATNTDLKKAMKEGKFREDLFYRLATIVIEVPPLRERKEDIPLLVEHFAGEFAEKYGKTIKRISPKFISYLSSLPFKGNVRELKNIVEREVILVEGEVLGAGYEEAVQTPNEVTIPPEGVNLKSIIEETEKRYIFAALKKAGGKKTEAAKLLGLTLREFRYRLSKYNPPKGGED
jgi:two-component system response regulator PilR (NtrC family)